MVKNPPAVQEKQVWSLGGEGALEKEMSTHSSILAWEIPWREEPGKLPSMGFQKSRTGLSDERTCKYTHIHTDNKHTNTIL